MKLSATENIRVVMINIMALQINPPLILLLHRYRNNEILWWELRFFFFIR